ncbi:MAG: DUF5752 family protein [Syntrophobacteraceae bacterium]|jgi:hypothetical protein|nr:DUF5752 family protein [Syntrophobacteraceae bacterium]
MADPFAVKDCALIAMGTGERAQNLRELRDRILTAHPGCIYHHFWGGLLKPRFDEPEFQNDFAAWSYHGLREARLAERLALIDPCEFSEIEDLRRELVEVIEERLAESEFVPWARADQQFYFTRSQIVVLDTDLRPHEPSALQALIPRLSVGSVFYHFIDARRRTSSSRDDFSEWLLGLDQVCLPLVDALGEIDPYFSTLTELRGEIDRAFKRFALGEGEACRVL